MHNKNFHIGQEIVLSVIQFTTTWIFKIHTFTFNECIDMHAFQKSILFHQSIIILKSRGRGREPERAESKKREERFL